MNLDQFRDAANAALAKAKKAVNTTPNNLVDLLKQAPIVHGRKQAWARA